MIQYRYNEDKTLEDLKSYIDATYGQHYSQNKFQATEFIIDAGHGEGFCIGNIFKYAQRYGKKDGRNKKDLMKIIHYAIMMLHVHEQEEKKKNTFSTLNHPIQYPVVNGGIAGPMTIKFKEETTK
jgi:hypothetical protein